MQTSSILEKRKERESTGEKGNKLWKNIVNKKYIYSYNVNKCSSDILNDDQKIQSYARAILKFNNNSTLHLILHLSSQQTPS